MAFKFDPLFPDRPSFYTYLRDENDINRGSLVHDSGPADKPIRWSVAGYKHKDPSGEGVAADVETAATQAWEAWMRRPKGVT